MILALLSGVHLVYEGARGLGDVLFHRNPVTLRAGLTAPFQFATFDPAANRASARKLASLRPEIVCFGHGAPLADGTLFGAFVAQL